MGKQNIFRNKGMVKRRGFCYTQLHIYAIKNCVVIKFVETACDFYGWGVFRLKEQCPGADILLTASSCENGG